MGGATVKRKYMVRQGLMILNQLFLIGFLCVMNTVGAKIPAENTVHIVLLTLLFFDGYYISGRTEAGKDAVMGNRSPDEIPRVVQPGCYILPYQYQEPDILPRHIDRFRLF